MRRRRLPSGLSKVLDLLALAVYALWAASMTGLVFRIGTVGMRVFAALIAAWFWSRVARFVHAMFVLWRDAGSSLASEPR